MGYRVKNYKMPVSLFSSRREEEQSKRFWRRFNAAIGKTILCGDCDGDGIRFGGDKCETCDGSGEIKDECYSAGGPASGLN